MRHRLLDIISEATNSLHKGRESLKTIDNRQQSSLRLCVGFSGGSDSVALLHALHALGHECYPVHCNFHLRDEESNRDEAFCRRFCLSLGLPLQVVQCDVMSECERTGSSVEMAARDLRYRAFENFRQHNALDFVAVAHHREDNIETFFLNLLRSSGIKGLAGMALLNSNHILRPMLHAPKGLVMDYIERNSLQYVTDSTNAADDFKRNRIRHYLLPLLAKQFPGSLEAITRSMAILQEQTLTLDGDTRRLNDSYRRPDGTIDIASLKANEACPPEALYRMENGRLSRQMVDDILDNVATSGRRFGPWELRHGLLLHPTPMRSIAINCEIIELRTKDDLRCPADQLLLDPETVDPSTLSLASTYEGLRFEPFGMKGSKLVRDILREHNIPQSRRGNFPVLFCGELPIWIVGLRASRHFTIPKDTRFPSKALLIRVLNQGFQTDD